MKHKTRFGPTYLCPTHLDCHVRSMHYQKVTDFLMLTSEMFQTQSGQAQTYHKTVRSVDIIGSSSDFLKPTCLLSKWNKIIMDQNKTLENLSTCINGRSRSRQFGMQVDCKQRAWELIRVRNLYCYPFLYLFTFLSDSDRSRKSHCIKL